MITKAAKRLIERQPEVLKARENARIELHKKHVNAAQWIINHFRFNSEVSAESLAAILDRELK